MKKVFIIALISVASSAFSQVGKVGINTSTPAATLDIQPNTANALTTATTAEGLLVPRVSRQRAANMGTTPAVSTLIYVNSVADGSAAGTTANVDAVGFYYFNGSVWTKLNAGGGADTSIYAGDGTLTSARTVTQNNQNLTFTTGTGQFIVNGTNNLAGAQIMKIRVESNANFTIQPDDYMIHWTSGTAGTVTLPAANVSTGRELCFYAENNVLNTGALGNGGNVNTGFGTCIISNGTIWITKNSY